MRFGRCIGVALVLAALPAMGLAPRYGDVNGSGTVDATDVQLVINGALGLPLEPDIQPDLNNDGMVNAVDVQIVINIALGILAGAEGADVTARVYTDEDGPANGALLRVFWRDYLLTQQTVDARGEVSLRVPADGEFLSFQASMPPDLSKAFDPATHEAYSNALRVIRPMPDEVHSLSFVLYRESPFLMNRTSRDEEEGMIRFNTPDFTVMLSDVPEELGIVGGSARAFSPANNRGAFPGEFFTRDDENSSLLISGGFASVNLLREGPDGNPEPVTELKDENGDPIYVTMRFRLAREDWSSLQDGANFSYLPGYVDRPDRLTQPLYIYNEVEGNWELAEEFGWLEDLNGPVPPEALQDINDGVFPNDLYMTARVRHFTFYNCDYPGSGACVTGVILDQNGDPVEDAKVTVFSMPAGVGTSSYFSNVIEMKTDANGRFGPASGQFDPWQLIPRSERGFDDDWNGNGRVDTFRFQFTVEKKNLCGLEKFDGTGFGYESPRFSIDEGCKDLGAFQVEIQEAKTKAYYINFVDSFTGDPLFVPEQTWSNYAEATLVDPDVRLGSDTWECACEDALCTWMSFSNESGRTFFNIPVLKPEVDITNGLEGSFHYQRDRPEFGELAFERAQFNFIHRKDKSHYSPGETVCSLELTGEAAVPPAATSATATARFEMGVGGAQLIIEHDIAGLQEATIRQGAPGETGPPLLNLTAGPGVVTRTLNNQEFDAVLAAPHYINLTSTAFPNGELRGDIEFCAYTYKVDVKLFADPIVEILSPSGGEVFLYDDLVTFEATGETLRGESIDELDNFLWTASGSTTPIGGSRVIQAPAWQAFGVTSDGAVEVEGFEFYAYSSVDSVGGITVLPVEIAIEAPPSTTVGVGASLPLEATVTNANNTAVQWTSSDASIATVNSSGVVTGVAPGTAAITARSQVDTSQTDTITITVDPLSAIFTVTPSSGTTDDSFLFDGTPSQGTITAYEWDFGDGSTGTGQTATHSYDDAGTYSVTLTVSGPGGTQVTSALTAVTVVDPDDNIPPAASFTVTPESGNPPLTVAVDASASTDPDGDIVSYAWNFGDGATGAGVTTSHTFDTSGEFIITLMVTDDGGATGTAMQSVRVNTPPVAAFSTTLTPVTGEAPLQVDFNAAASTDPDGQIVLYAWDFGDGATQQGEVLITPTHLYPEPGIYEATLTVTDNEGLTGSASETITAIGLTAAFELASLELDESEGTYTAVLDASASVSIPFDIVEYRWEIWPPGTIPGGVSKTSIVSVQDTPTFSFEPTSAGDYFVELTIENSEGQTDFISDTFEVVPPQAEFVNVTLVSESPGGTILTNNLDYLAMSANGRFVAFRSGTAPMDDGYETTGGPWVYIKDMETGGLVQVPRVNPNPGQNPVFRLSLSADGNRVAYQGFGNQIYVYDIALDEHYIASAPPGGEEVGNADSRWPSISADGRFVAFQSAASNLVDGVTGNFNIFVTDLQEDEVIHVGRGREPTITADGSKVVLWAALWQYFDTGDLDNQLLIVDWEEDEAEVVSANTDGSTEGSSLFLPRETVSTMGNGEWVAFTARSSLLAPEVPDNGVFNIYLKNTETGVLTQLTESESGECDINTGEQPGGAGVGRISEDLRWFAYQPDGFDADCGQFGPFFQNLFLEDTDTGDRADAAFDMWSRDGQFFREVVLTPDGRYIAFRYDSRIYRAENPFWEGGK